jgi:hypothetical protein
MSRVTSYVSNANAALAEGLLSGKEISLDAVAVLHSFASLLVPISVAIVPNGQRLVPSLDAAVDRGYDILAQAVELPYDRAVATLDRVSSAAA